MSNSDFAEPVPILLDLDEIDSFKVKKIRTSSLNDVRELVVGGIAHVIRKLGFPYVGMLDTYPGSTRLGISLNSDNARYEIRIDITLVPVEDKNVKE